MTGRKAVYNRETLEEWLSHTENAENPRPKGHQVRLLGGRTSLTRNDFRDELNKRDMEWIRKINPEGYTLERWIIENKYNGTLYQDPVLKIVADVKSLRE